MPKILFSLVLCLLSSLSLLSAQDQVQVAIAKADGKIELWDANQKAPTQTYKLEELVLDVLDAQGRYSGSVQLKAGETFPKEELQAGESLKVKSLKVQELSSGKQLELKAPALIWR